MRFFLLSTTALVLGFAPLAAIADDEQVVVTAARIPIAPDQTGSSVTVVDAAQIEARQERSLPDALQDVPGLDIVQTGALGGQTSLFMRGTRSEQVKVLLDGIDIGDPSTPGGAADIGKLLTGDIARVEVLRGPGSALYGSDAIGGVINIITRSGEGPLSLTAMAEGGSFDTFNQRLSLSGSEDGFHYAATIDHVHAGATMVTPLDLLPPGQARNPDFYDGLQASTKLGYDIASNLDIGLVAHYGTSLGKITNDGFDVVTSFYGPSANQTRNVTQQYDTRAFAHLVLWDGRLDQTLGLAYSSAITSSADPDNGYVLDKGSRVKLDWQGALKVMDGQTLVLGAETARDAVQPGVSFGAPTLSAGYTTNAGYAELNSDFGGGVFANIGLRYDDNSRFGGKVTYHLAPTWNIAATGTRLKASFGTGFKSPALQQLFGAFGGNPLLKPETSTGYDAGFEQQLWDGQVTGGATWFHNDIRNLINNVFIPPATFSYVNIGKARTQGVESFLAWKALDTLSLRADYTYTDAIDAVAHTPLPRVPHHKLGLSADWQALDNLSLGATLQFTGPQADLDREAGTPVRLPAFTVLNLAASYRVTENWSLFGRVENAVDERYEEPYGFLRPGIGAFAGIKANF